MQFTVTDDDTALALGSGEIPVLGTPRLIAWLEAATVAEAAPRLGPVDGDGHYVADGEIDRVVVDRAAFGSAS
jgi:predicted thioesterase